MQTIRDLTALRAARAGLTGTVALVPTMGALHAGHMALIADARSRADHVVASIFVNPTQFLPGEDLARYPRREAADAVMLDAAGVALLWLPDVAMMYPAGFATSVHVVGLTDQLCGASRPGHFDGVATVVAKLLGQMRPDIAVFGEKDWQQLAVIRRMAADLDLGVAIHGSPTQRDADGLALSSRNLYLTDAERRVARLLPRTLGEAAAAIERGDAVDQVLEKARTTLAKSGFDVDYVELVDASLGSTTSRTSADRVLVAARLGQTRLIDNLPIRGVAE